MWENIIDLIEAIEERFGFKPSAFDYLVVIVILVSILVSIGAALLKLYQTYILYRNQKLLNEDLYPYFDASDVDRATRHFISTKFQNVSPSEDDEPGQRYIASAKEELIPLLMKKGFSKGQHFYMILGETGMGKTTFLINLYLKLKKKNRFFKALPYDAELFAFGDPDSLSRMRAIADKRKTIVLLDAFDEDVPALRNYKQRLDEVIGVCREFKAIIITCRTQFFPTRDEEPHETGYYSLGSNNPIRFQKLYISVFDEKDVRTYLRRKYPIWRLNKRRKAQRVADQIPSLVVRPMLLSHIDEIIHSRKAFQYTYQIYEEMIQQWLIRESKKPDTIKQYKSLEIYRKLLYKFSLKLAEDLYRNRDQRGGYFITKEEIMQSKEIIEISTLAEDDVSMSANERRSKSLLNRNAYGHYKFAHKSILEYFLAKCLFKDAGFYRRFYFKGMDAAKNFFQEMVADFLQQKNITLLYEDGRMHNKNQILRTSEFLKIKYIHIKRIQHINAALLSSFYQATSLKIVDFDLAKVFYCLRLIEKGSVTQLLREIPSSPTKLVYERLNDIFEYFHLMTLAEAIKDGKFIIIEKANQHMALELRDTISELTSLHKILVEFPDKGNLDGNSAILLDLRYLDEFFSDLYLLKYSNPEFRIYITVDDTLKATKQVWGDPGGS
jgi:hypothetical protein